jgi:hypothetical protein
LSKSSGLKTAGRNYVHIERFEQAARTMMENRKLLNCE